MGAMHVLLFLVLSCHLLYSGVGYALLSSRRSASLLYKAPNIFVTKRNSKHTHERHESTLNKFPIKSKLAQSSNDIQPGTEDTKTSIATRLLGGFSSSVRKNFLWSKYSSSLFVRPVATKSVSSLLGFMLGDVLAQFFLKRGSGSTGTGYCFTYSI